MDKTFQLLKTQVIDLHYGLSTSNCENIFIEFEVKYTTLKRLFLASREKLLRDNKKGIKRDILSCERSLKKEMNFMLILCQLTSYA